MRLVPITLNGKTFQLYYTAGTAMALASMLRNLGRLEKKDTEREAFDLVRAGDLQAIVMALGVGLDIEANRSLTRNKNIREQIQPWIDDEVANHKDEFGDRIIMPILDAAKAAGVIDFVWKRPEPATVPANDGGDQDRPTNPG